MTKSQFLFHPHTQTNLANWESLTSKTNPYTITESVATCFNGRRFKLKFPNDSGASTYFWEAIDPVNAPTMRRQILNIPPAVVNLLRYNLDHHIIGLDEAAYQICKFMRRTQSIRVNVAKYWQRRLDRHKKVRSSLKTMEKRGVVLRKRLEDLDIFITEHRKFPAFASFTLEVILPDQQHAPFGWYADEKEPH